MKNAIKKDKVEQSREWSNAPPPCLNVVAIEKGAFKYIRTEFEIISIDFELTERIKM